MDAQTRRRERRAEKQAQWKAANPLLVGVSAKPVNKPSPENTNQKSPSVDCEQILKDFSDYASTETDKKKLIERYQRDWQLMAGNEEAQAKCVQVMNIRVNELKQAA